jgi:hypothetical protein
MNGTSELFSEVFRYLLPLADRSQSISQRGPDCQAPERHPQGRYEERDAKSGASAITYVVCSMNTVGDIISPRDWRMRQTHVE